MTKDINTVQFPEVKEGDRILWSDNKWYIFVNGEWILE